MVRLVFASQNVHKVREMRAVLGSGVDILSLADIGCNKEIPEEAATLEGNALAKARYVYATYGVDCFADDTGLFVTALDGAPGIYTARFGALHGYGTEHDSDANSRCLLDKLQGVTDRSAYFRTVIALILDGKEYLFSGTVTGTITPAPYGSHGFGYDPLFCPDGYQQTFAQMGPAAKNRLSHRAQAVRQLQAFLQQLPASQQQENTAMGAIK